MYDAHLALQRVAALAEAVSTRSMSEVTPPGALSLAMLIEGNHPETIGAR
jgi:hypothetical protein